MILGHVGQDPWTPGRRASSGYAAGRRNVRQTEANLHGAALEILADRIVPTPTEDPYIYEPDLADDADAFANGKGHEPSRVGASARMCVEPGARNPPRGRGGGARGAGRQPTSRRSARGRASGALRPRRRNTRRETGPRIPSRRDSPSPSGPWSPAPRSRRRSPRGPGRPRYARCARSANGRPRAFPESGDEGWAGS